MSRVSDLRIDYCLDSDLKTANGTIQACVEGISCVSVRFSAKIGDKTVFQNTTEVSQDGIAEVVFRVIEPQLWYPYGYGEQPLYEVTATINDGDDGLATVSRKIGFRKGELIQIPDEVGKSFFFRINGIDIFCGGSNWIPADSFLPTVTDERYRKWLELLVAGNQIMAR